MAFSRFLAVMRELEEMTLLCCIRTSENHVSHLSEGSGWVPAVVLAQGRHLPLPAVLLHSAVPPEGRVGSVPPWQTQLLAQLGHGRGGDKESAMSYDPRAATAVHKHQGRSNLTESWNQ